MSPFSPQVKSVEAFQRDIEPAIIAARNELVTADTFMTYTDGDLIDSYTKMAPSAIPSIRACFSSVMWIRTISTTPTTSTFSPSDSSYPKNAGRLTVSSS